MNLREMRLPTRSMDHLRPIVGEEKLARLKRAVGAARTSLDGRTVWNVNSTAAGGGVAELLHFLLPYARGFGVDARWLVLGGDSGFFTITKRLCNGLYGILGDGGPLSRWEHAHYREVSRANAKGLLERVRPRDVVLLHDPQAAGLVDAVRQTGAKVVWRCHVGCDVPNAHTERCWEFLRPYLEGADAFVFSTPRHVPGWVERGRGHIIAPSIDPFSAKNFEMDRSTVRRILVRVGLLRGAGESPAPLVARVYGSPIRIRRRVDVIRYGPGPSPDTPLVVQVSRWDRLKDMLGVMRVFADHVDPSRGAHLALVGPEVGGVADDPEARGMLEECHADWLELPPEKRRRIQLVCLPMEDLEENAAVVNAVQRYAAVVVQKSLAEGFGLTVTEAMWKGRPVVASAVGGIADQIVHGEHGLLIENPTDLRAFASTIDLLLGDPCYAEELGRGARSRVVDRFLGDRHLAQYAGLLERLVRA